jgi:hypothetical protein
MHNIVVADGVIIPKCGITKCYKDFDYEQTKLLQTLP